MPGARRDCTGADFPVHRRTRYSLHFILNRLSSIPPCARSALYGVYRLNNPSLRTSKSFSRHSCICQRTFTLRIPFVWR
ncbi:hypothetical protein TNCV_641411 [Trichonephila clavipes]|nr:hypothetical protein TNCV_641411 [Trichonephila clavipes]